MDRGRLEMQDPYDVISALWVLILAFGLSLFTLLVIARCLGMGWWRLASALGSKWAQRREADRHDRAQVRRAMAEILGDGETLAMLRSEE